MPRPVVRRDRGQILLPDVQVGAQGQAHGMPIGMAHHPAAGDPDMAVEELLVRRTGSGVVMNTRSFHQRPPAGWALRRCRSVCGWQYWERLSGSACRRRVAAASRSTLRTSLSTRGSPGNPRTRSPRMFFMILVVPPSIELACTRRNAFCGLLKSIALRQSRYREMLLAEWDKLNWLMKLDLLWRSLGAFRDALWLQPQRLEERGFE